MSENTLKFDLIVIGGGPAGVVGATTAASMGKKVALVESRAELGGAGANTGTVPSKTLRETALALSGVRSRGLYGVDLSLRREATVADFLRHEQHVKAGLNPSLSQRMDAWNTAIYCGSAAFADSHTVSVGGDNSTSLQADYILVATGSAPARPPGFPFGCREIYDSDTILEIDRLPETMAVVGAGVVGSEYASTFAALGASVHLIDGRNALLPFLAAELSRALTAAMERNGIRFHWGARPLSYCQEQAGKVTVTLDSGDPLSVDVALIASGRKSNTETLNLAASGVTVGDRGIIPVDANYRTNVPHIFAAGDVIGFPALASTSMQQARCAVRAAFNGAALTQPSRFLPTGVYTIPEVSMAGETEEALQRAGVEYVVGRAPYGRSARGRIIGDTDGFLKLLFRRSDMRLLGVHAMGEQATELVHVGMTGTACGHATHVVLLLDVGDEKRRRYRRTGLIDFLQGFRHTSDSEYPPMDANICLMVTFKMWFKYDFVAVGALGLITSAVGISAQQSQANTPPPPSPPAPSVVRRTGGFVPGQKRPPGDPAQIARGKTLYAINCRACHGADLRGGDLGGPNLLRSQIALTDQDGELIVPIIQGSRQNNGMPAIPVNPEDAKAVAAYVRSVVGMIGVQGTPPSLGKEAPSILVGNAAEGQAYFAAKCSSCHSPTGDLKGIAAKITDPRKLQTEWVEGGRWRVTPPDAINPRTITATVTLSSGETLEGQLVRIDDFLVTILNADGAARTFRRDGDVPRVVVHDPMKAHRDLLSEYTDKDIHDVTAYLVTLK